MREPRTVSRHSGLRGFAFGLLVSAASLPAMAQSLDMGGAAEAPPAPEPSLDLDVNPSAPLPKAAASAPSPQDDSLKAGLAPLSHLLDGTQPPAATGNVAPPAPATAAPGDGQKSASGEAAPSQPPPEPVSLDHPTVVDTAKLSAGQTTVALYGIIGQQGDAAQGLQSFIAAAGAKVTCQAQSGGDYICLLPDGTDVAEAALINGAAQAKTDASDAYHAQEAQAQAARRGIWSNLPPPPVQVQHPVVRDTATLVADNKTYILDGIEGLRGIYASQLQGYIAAHDDSLMCQPQSNPDHYICVLSDGTDIAKVALVNGAAKVGPDAADGYRVQQGEALANKRGLWANVSMAALYSTTVRTVPATPVVVGDEADGVNYVGGVPSAVIDGQAVFLSYAGVAGWGYYDGYHHWHGAPASYRMHMERFHPGGVGLRGYAGGFHPGGGFGAPHFGGGFVHPAAMGGGFHAVGGVSHVAVGGGGGHHR